MAKLDSDALNIRQTNAVVKEIREIEKREKNVIVCNVPETDEESPEERKKQDENKIKAILKELKAEDVQPVNVIRVGMKGRYPRKILVILRSINECERVLRCGEETRLQHDVFITRDRTFNQREEARLFRQEREKAEREGTWTERGRGRGRGGRPRGRGSVRGRGSRGAPSGSRKRRASAEDDETKRARLDTPRENDAGHNASNDNDTPARSQDQPNPMQMTPQSRLLSVEGRQSTPLAPRRSLVTTANSEDLNC